MSAMIEGPGSEWNKMCFYFRKDGKRPTNKGDEEEKALEASAVEKNSQEPAPFESPFCMPCEGRKAEWD